MRCEVGKEKLGKKVGKASCLELDDAARDAVLGLDRLGTGRELLDVARDPIVEAGAEADHQVGFLHRVVGVRRPVHPQHSERERVPEGKKKKKKKKKKRGSL